MLKYTKEEVEFWNKVEQEFQNKIKFKIDKIYL